MEGAGPRGPGTWVRDNRIDRILFEGDLEGRWWNERVFIWFDWMKQSGVRVLCLWLPRMSPIALCFVFIIYISCHFVEQTCLMFLSLCFCYRALSPKGIQMCTQFSITPHLLWFSLFCGWTLPHGRWDNKQKKGQEWKMYVFLNAASLTHIKLDANR